MRSKGSTTAITSAMTLIDDSPQSRAVGARSKSERGGGGEER